MKSGSLVIAAVAATAPAAEPRPLTERLRALIVEACGEATLTCAFQPGGRLDGVGIRSHFYCAGCGGSRLWHEVAEGLRTIHTAEDIIRAHRESKED